MEMRPRRAARVIDEAAGDETVVYNLATDGVSLLNRTTAAVWRYCDGENSADDIAALVAADLEMPVDSELVRVALAELADAGLLADATGLDKTMSRRKLMKRLAIGAAALPLVTSIAAPTAAAAASHGCETSGDCDFGEFCSNGMCVSDPNFCDPPCDAFSTCVNGTCLPISNGGGCIPECEPGLECINGICEPF